MAMSCQAYFEDQEFNIENILDRIVVTSPQSFDELSAILNSIEYLIQRRKIQLVIVDSLSFLRYSVDSTLLRTQICFKILDKLHKLSVRNNFAVVVTSELTNQITTKDEVDLAPASGPLCAHRVHKRLMLTRLNNNQFAVCAIKSLTLPRVSSKFQITADGIRDIIK